MSFHIRVRPTALIIKDARILMIYPNIKQDIIKYIESQSKRNIDIIEDYKLQRNS